MKKQKIETSEKNKDKYLIVFFKDSCPLCREGSKEVQNAVKQSKQKIYFANVQSDTGQTLVKKYNVEYAPTILLIDSKNNKVFSTLYAQRNENKKIEVNSNAIQNFLVLGQPYELKK